MVGGGTEKPVIRLKIIQSYQSEKGWLLSYKSTSFNYKKIYQSPENILWVNSKSNKIFMDYQGTDSG